jgi:hypothetical protein
VYQDKLGNPFKAIFELIKIEDKFREKLTFYQKFALFKLRQDIRRDL